MTSLTGFFLLNMNNMDLEKLKNYFQNDRFAASSGIKLVEVSKGYCKAKLEIEERHLNAANVVQGGAIFTLADFAFALAANSQGQLALAINVNISFLKGKSSGILYATATEVADPNRIGAYDVLITDENNAVIAHFNGIVYRKNEIHPF
jgi:acyl-CoA thioesterase